VPGKYTALWFEATREGVFHLFCAEYCGTLHAGMIGKLVALKPIDYQRWLSEKSADEPPAVAGERLFQQRGCAVCHQTPATALGPSLTGLFGRRVQLSTGETVTADEEYVRESILNPRARLVAGYQPTMPTFQGQLSEEALHQIMAYLKLLGRSAEEKTSS
jgi:cytochrome c oxidase subunit 2